MSTAIDPGRRLVRGPGGAFRPPRQQWQLICCLAARPGIVRTRGEIMDALGIAANYPASVDSLVARTRRRLRAVGADPIRTAPGHGYFWEE